VLIRGAIARSVKMAEACPRMGVPQYFRRKRQKGELQLLLPLALAPEVRAPRACLTLALGGAGADG
jgi:hypothetical protein